MTNIAKEHALTTIRRLQLDAGMIEEHCRIHALPFSRQIMIEIAKTLKSYERIAKGVQK